jgi:formamidopyrimidine-DNA glycosylase
MPELPEVEITIRKLRPLIKGRQVLKFWTDLLGRARVFQAEKISRDIQGRTIESLERRGKAIIIRLSGGRILALHQGMSGRILMLSGGTADKHIHYRFSLSGGKELALRDPRKFGVLWYGKETEVLNQQFFANLGKDPLEISSGEFLKILSRHSGMIKPLLLRQDVFSGIGNIMADESLWKARIHPRAKTLTLNNAQRNRLFKALRFVLKKSISIGGSTMRDWLHPDSEPGGYYEKRYVYDRQGDPCFRCKTVIQKIRIASRGTYFCPKCQKLV